MSKLSFRARALDASKPMPIYLAEELPDLPEYSAINRAVPQMPSGMEKEEECEHHLQRAICTGLIIPTPEVYQVEDLEFYERCYPSNYKMPKQHIHMQPLWHEQEAPEYDIDSEDDRWLKQQRHPELTELKFEEMMDKLERSSGQTVVTLNEAKLLLERNDDLVIAIYDYWLNKRLKTERPLIPSVKTECRPGQPTNNPYLAFRRRTEKMQTRKNRKNDESSYEKMLKLRRDLARALTLLELVAKREKAKRDLVKLTALLAERRYAAGDFAGQMLADIPQSRPTYSAVALAAQTATFRREPFIPNYASTARPAPVISEQTRQREKRPYKRRKHRLHASGSVRDSGVYTSSEEETSSRAETSTPPDDGPFAFRRKAGCLYEMPTSTLYGDPVDPEDSSKEALYKHEIDERYRFNLTTLKTPYERCIGFARRRLGRGGRVVLDRVKTPLDDLWPNLPFQFPSSSGYKAERAEEVKLETEQHVFPVTMSRDYQRSRRHPWRHAFRRHLRKNQTLWTDSDNVDSSVIVDSSVVPIVRKRLRSASSDSSYDSDNSLEPAERTFETFLDDVSKNWLHFRAKTPPCSPTPPPTEDLIPVSLDTPISVEISQPTDTFTTSEFTLRELYDIDPDSSNLDLEENLGLTEDQVESILADTDLKTLDATTVKDKIDILDELVEDGHFLGEKKGKRASFGSSVVNVLPLEQDSQIFMEKFVEKMPQVEVKQEFKVKTEVKEVKEVPKKAVSDLSPQIKPEPKKQVLTPKAQKDETLQEMTLAHGVQLKTVQTKHSPLKKHIITSAAPRRDGNTMPQIVTVAVSDNLKVRLQNHVLTSTSASGETSVVGLLQNGPYAVAASVPATIAAQNMVPGSSSPRRLSSPVLLPPAKVKLLQAQRVPAVVSLATRGQLLSLKGPQLVNVLRADKKRVLLHDNRPRLSVALRAPLVNVRPRAPVSLRRAMPPSRPLPPALVANLLHKTVHLPKQKLNANVQAIAFARQARIVTNNRPSEEPASASAANDAPNENEDRSTNSNGAVRRRTNEPMEVT